MMRILFLGVTALLIAAAAWTWRTRDRRPGPRELVPRSESLDATLDRAAKAGQVPETRFRDMDSDEIARTLREHSFPTAPGFGSPLQKALTPDH